METLGTIAVAIAVLIVARALFFSRITIYEYERGVKYSKGKYRKTLDPGQYRYMSYFTKIDKIDIRPRFVVIPGQELLTSEGVTLKISLAAKFEIADPSIAVNKTQDYYSAFYTELQLALREIVGNSAVDDLLQKRNEFSSKLTQLATDKIHAIGLNLLSVDIKDIMFPGSLKETFAQVVAAQKQGQAALERARGETAALRNLANAAKVLDDNPNLLQLRIIQTLSENQGNTIVFGNSPQIIPVAKAQNTKENGP